MKRQYIEIQAIFFGLLVLSLFEFNLRFVVTQPLTYVLLGVFALYVVLAIKKPTIISSLRHYSWLLIAVASIALVLSIHHPSLQAKWGVIDDHEIMAALGIDGKMSLSQVPQLVINSEAGKPGLSPRYRPIYSLFRNLETAVWDNRPGGWYATRLAIFAFFIAAVWYASRPIIGFMGGGLLATYILTSDYWRDIVARLGPSEIYVALGLGLFFIFGYKVLKEKPHWLSWLGMTLGYVIAVGAKENMVVLVAPVVVLGVYLVSKKKMTTVAAASLIVMLAWTLFMTWAVGSAMLKTGQDVYARSTTADSRISVAILSLKTQQSKQLMISITLTIAFLGYLLIRAKGTRLVQPTIIFAVLQVLLLGLFCSQFVFYNAAWPDHNRYDFPGLLYLPLYFISLCWFARLLLLETKLDPRIITAMKWAVYLGVIFTIAMRGLVSTQVKIQENVKHTIAHTARIQKIADVLRADPSATVIIESGNVWDYEPVYSYGVFLRAFEVANPLHLRLHDFTPESVHQGLEHELAVSMVKASEEGNDTYRPLSEADMQNCYSIVLSGSPTTSCQPL